MNSWTPGLEYLGDMDGSVVLRGANLSRANLEGADLRNAKLDGACLDDAILIGARLPN